MSKLVEGWRDLRMNMLAGRLGTANFPTLDGFGPTGAIEQLKFILDDYVYIAVQVAHDIKEGSTVYPHVHWTTNGTNVQAVKWEISYTLAKGHDQENFPADVVLTVQEAAAGTAWRHMLTEDITGFIAPEIDSLWIARIKRITNGGTDNTDQVFGLSVGLYYEVQQYATPNRIPDFYA
jgi:hypothetical protein